jgi:hypothetical protein
MAARNCNAVGRGSRRRWGLLVLLAARERRSSGSSPCERRPLCDRRSCRR